MGDQMVYIPLPDEPSRASIINAVLRKSPVDPTVDRDQIARITNGYSGADITEICNRAAKEAVKEAIAREVEMRNKEDEDHPDYDPNFTRDEDYDPVPMISVRHFEESMKFARRSVSDTEIRKYEAIAQQQHARIGLPTDRISTNNSAAPAPSAPANMAPAADDDDEDLYS